MPAPGTSDLFTSFSLNGFSTNRPGQLVFQGTAGGKSGIWAQDPSGILRLIVRSGDSIEIEPGLLRTITALEIFPNSGGFRNSGGSDGRARIINDAGQILFGATLDNGQKGLFVSDLAVHYVADFDFDGDVDGRDFLIWQRGGSPTPLSADDLADWQVGYGAGPLGGLATLSVPEPPCWHLIYVVILLCRVRRNDIE